MRILQRLLLAASMCCLVATANAAPMDDALSAHDRGDYAQALKIFRSLAAQGNAPAQYNIGYMYSNGQGVTQNYQEALKWYRLAADQGYSIAQTYIGYAYLNGVGVKHDYKESAKWFRLAAAQGKPSAIENLKIPEMVAAARQEMVAAARQSNDSKYSSNSNWQPVDDPQSQESQQPQQPPRSTSIKTGTQQEEQVSIKTNRKIDQPRHTANRAEAPERTSPSKLVSY